MCDSYNFKSIDTDSNSNASYSETTDKISYLYYDEYD